MRILQLTFIVACLLAFFAIEGYAQIGTVKGFSKISDTAGNFTGTLSNQDSLGEGAGSIGDLNGDGVIDLAVGEIGNDDGGLNRGGLWIMFMNANGTVNSHQKISDTDGNFTGALIDNNFFGGDIENLGDLDGDGITDLAVSGFGDNAIWILFLNIDGTVKAHQKIGQGSGNFSGILDAGSAFGFSIDSLGDFDGDGVVDLIVGQPLVNEGGTQRGAIWILSLDTDGTVKNQQKLSHFLGSFNTVIDDTDHFGYDVASLGDLDGDGVTDLAASARFDDDGGADRGMVLILFLNPDGTVKAEQKISDTAGGFTGGLVNSESFGSGLGAISDLDGDGVTELAVGSISSDGGPNRGAIYVLFLNSNGTVKAHQKISDTQGNFTCILDDNDLWGGNISPIGDFDGDGVMDIVTMAQEDDDGGTDRGAVWILYMNAVPIRNPIQLGIDTAERIQAGIADLGIPVRGFFETPCDGAVQHDISLDDFTTTLPFACTGEREFGPLYTSESLFTVWSRQVNAFGSNFPSSATLIIGPPTAVRGKWNLIR